MHRPIAPEAEACLPPLAEAPAAARTRFARTGDRALALLLAALVALPALLLGLGAWAAWRDAWRGAEAEVAQAAEAVAEYGLRVLGAHAVAAGRVDAVLRGLSDEEVRAGEAVLHRELRALVAEMPQAEAAYVIDRDGAVLLSANLFPVPRATWLAADRDFFLDLRAAGAPAVHVSRVHTGRLDGSLFFAVSRRRTGTGNADLPPGAFDGLVNLSVYPNRLAEGLRRVVPHGADMAALIRADGEILASSNGLAGPRRLSPTGPFATALAGGAERFSFEGVSVVDGVHRLYAVRRIEGWPVYAQAARPRAAILAEWRRAVAGQLAVGVPATLALLALAALVRRGQAGLAAANAGLEARVAQRTAALADRERRLNKALEAGRVFAFEFDPAADRVLRSPNAAAILGLPEADAMRATGSAFVAGLHPEDRGPVLAALAGATPDRPAYAVRYRWRRPDGRLLWLQDEGVAEFGPDGRMRRLASLCRDVTAEVEAERTARAAEARLREATEGAGLGTYEIDFARGAAWFDARAVEILGGGLPAATWFPLDGPDRARLAARMHPDDRAAFAAAWEAVASGAAPGWALELRLRRPDGSWTWDFCHGTVVERDEATGRPRRLVGVELDVSELRRLEADLRQAQKMEALGQLAGGIAHDFNNVLQAVSGTATMIERGAADPEEVRRRTRMLMEAVGRGAAVTGRLLAFARRGELRVGRVEPAALLAGLREILAPALGSRIEVRVEAGPGLPSLLADRDQLQTALVNLATNARDAMPDGGTLTLAAGAAEVVEGAPRVAGVPAGLSPGSYVRLSVRDTGAGMDAATLSRVTEPFFTTKPAGKGTGLGLPMAKGFAERSGGGFAIESEAAHGTVVTLWFPRAGEEVVAAPEAVPATDPRNAEPPAGPRILVVDDDAAVRAAVVDELGALGLRVQVAGDSAQALALMDAGAAVDALVTNLTMPGLDGLALIREARRRCPDLPAVLLTGEVRDAAALGAREGGRFALLYKPARGADIAARIAVLLDG